MAGDKISSGLEAILGIMESEDDENGKIHILDTIHFSSTHLHGYYNEPDDLTRNIGSDDSGRSLTLTAPLITTKRLFEDLTSNAQLGIALGQAISGMPVNIYHGMPPEMEEMITSYKPKTIFSFGPHRQDFDIERLRRSDMIQIVTIDNSNDIPIYIPEIRKGKDVIRLADLLHELNNVPIIYGINSSDIKKDLDFILISKVDSILIDCSSDLYEKRSDINMLTSLVQANRQFEVFKSKESGLKLIVNGPIRNISDIMKMMALGADIVGIDQLTRSFLRSYLTFKTGDKYITNDDLKEPNDVLDWAEIGELYSEFLQILIERLKKGLQHLNIDPEKGLNISDIETSDYSTASISGIPLQGFGKPVPFWRHRS